MNLSSRLVSIFVVLIGFTGYSLAQPRAAADDLVDIRSITDATIRPLMAEYDVPGLAVAITLNGQSHFFNYGVASRESNAPVSEETLFEVGSISKTFTATLTTYAQALGKLSLDDRPGRYIPELKGSAIDQASLLHLATYTSGGLPLQLPGDVTDDERMIRYFLQWQPDAAPGAHRRYSNPSIGLLGRIAGLTLAGDFHESLERVLLPRLGIHDTYVQVPDGAMGRYAWGYNAANEPIRVSPGMFDAEAYGIRSTAADMIRLVQANIDPSDLDEPTQRAIEATQVGYFEVGEMVQGIGWEQYPYPVTLERLLAGNSRTMSMEANAVTPITAPRASSGPVLFNKTGSTNGFGAYVAFVPERKTGVVLLANRNFPVPVRVEAAHRILKQIEAVAE